MKTSLFSIVINPNKPVKQYGHIQQTQEIFDVHDDLKARFMIIEDSFYFVFISVDTLGLSLEFINELEQSIKPLFDKEIKLCVSSTHTHYGADTNDESYSNQLKNQFIDALSNIKYQNHENLFVSYVCINYDEVGKSRISNHEANVILGLLEIYDGDKVIASIINHNTHPTILDASTTHYFSSEFCGYLLNELTNIYKDEFFTYTSGAMGDISTRFTRSSQDYNSVITLGSKLTKKVIELKNKTKEKYLMKLNYEETTIHATHEFVDIVLDDLSLTYRELETIEYGKIVRKNLEENKENLMKTIKISKLSFNKVNMIFCPNELFSYYLNAIDTKSSMLCCYSNGYGPYMLGINQRIITYELFTDTFSNDTKLAVFKQINEYSYN